MLTKMENRVMSAVYKECIKKNPLLITPNDLINMVGEKGVTPTTLEKIMTDLNMDGYFDLVYSDRHGETVYCIALTEKGKGYNRNRKVLKRNLVYRRGLSVALAFLSFIIGLILKAIFR